MKFRENWQILASMGHNHSHKAIEGEYAVRKTAERNGNYLLDAFPGEVRQRLAPHLRLDNLPLGQILHEPGDTTREIYFPTDAVVSILYVTQDGATAALSTVGDEGMIGLSAFMSGSSTPGRAVVQTAGNAYRMPAELLAMEFRQDEEMQRTLLLYTQSVITQIAQTVVCNRHHTIYQQMSRWLLDTLDRRSGDQVITTQEMIAGILGVRREGVTLAAKKLQEEGLILYARGKITVPDRARLERATCECYGVVKRETLRLLPYLTQP